MPIYFIERNEHYYKFEIIFGKNQMNIYNSHGLIVSFDFLPQMVLRNIAKQLHNLCKVKT